MEAGVAAEYVEVGLEVETVCRRLHPRLVGALALHCGDANLAEELAQETLTRLWERWGQVSRLDSPAAWAFRVGFNLANSRFRRMQCERRANRRLAGAREPQHDEAQAVAVREAVRTLPKRQRAALVLRYFADLSVEQTAAVMKCAPGTVKALTSQAISRLRVELDIGPDKEQEDADCD